MPKSALAAEFGELRAGHQIPREWQQKVEPGITPAMTKRQVEDAAATAAGNAVVLKRVKLWHTVELAVAEDAPELSGRLAVKTRDDKRIVVMRERKDIHEDFGLPSFIADATADLELLKLVWPQVQTDRKLYPLMEHVRFRQMVDRSFSMDAIVATGANVEDRRRKARRMWAALLCDASRYGGQRPVMVVTYKATEDYIKSHLYVPPWITLAHHGGVAGTDQWRDVRAIYIVGRTLPDAEHVTVTAEVLTGVGIAERRYVEVEVPIHVHEQDGCNAVMVKQWRHSHPVAERVRRKICEGGLMQAIGRVRGMWRDEFNPVDVNIWTDVPVTDELGYPVEAILWDDVTPSVEQTMIGVGGVWLENAKDAASAYPGLFTHDALRQARTVSFPYNRTLIGDSHTPHQNHPSTQANYLPMDTLYGTVEHLFGRFQSTTPPTTRYRKAGRGQKAVVAAFIPGFDRQDCHGWLERKLGPLAEFEFIVPRRPPPPRLRSL